MALYGLEAYEKLIEQYENATNGDFMVYTICGGLLDSHIITGNGCKTAVIKEIGLNEWSSAYTIRLYNKMPAKYARVIELLESGQTEQAENLFYK